MKYFLQIEKHSPLLLGRLILRKRWIDYSQLLEGLFELHNKKKGKLGQILLAKKFISEKQLEEVLQEQKYFLTTSPSLWKYIPDTVILSSASFQKKSIGNAIPEIIQQFKDAELEKPLQQFLCEDLSLISAQDIKNFLNNIEIGKWYCNTCSREYHLFHCNTTVSCPICWDTNLDSKIHISVKAHPLPDSKESPQKKVNPPSHLPSSSENIIKISLVKQEIVEISDSDLEEPTKPNKVKLRNFFDVTQNKFSTRKNLFNRICLYCIVIIIFLFSISILFLENNDKSSIENSIIINMDAKPTTSDLSVETIKVPINLEKIYQEIENILFVDKISRSILFECNKKIEQLISLSSEDIYSGDYYNLQGRILFYLIWIDEGTFIKEEKIKLAKEAQHFLEKALQVYQNQKYKTKFHLKVMKWMPETNIYKTKPWDKNILEIYFFDCTKVKKDTQIFLDNVKKFIK